MKDSKRRNVKPAKITLPYWIKAFLLLSLLALVVGGAWFYRDQQQTMQKNAEVNLAAIAQLKVNQIVDWRTERREVGAVISENQFFINSVMNFLVKRSDEYRKAIFAYFRSLQANYHYANILLVGADEKVILGLSGNLRLNNSAYTSALAEALREHTPVFSDLYTATEDLTPHISVVAPLFSGTENAPTPLGAVILISDATKFLYPLIQSWPTHRKTAETMLVRRDGDDVLFLNDLRHRGDTALKLRIPLSHKEMPASMAVTGKTGIVKGRDYRGVEVLAAIYPVPESSWFMVAKVDAAEVFAAWRFRSALILAFILGLTFCIGTTGSLLWQREKKSHYRSLYLSEAKLRSITERHSVTLKSIGDAVIATDARCVVELLNPEAEALTGWMEAEARGRPLEEVFRIHHELTRQKVENPVARVLREGVVAGLANHTMLVARDGTERPIADLGSPIRDDKGEITGAVLVIRDQTEERTAAVKLAERERLLLAIEQAGDMIVITDSEGTIQYVNPAFERVTGLYPQGSDGEKSAHP